MVNFDSCHWIWAPVLAVLGSFYPAGSVSGQVPEASDPGSWITLDDGASEEEVTQGIEVESVEWGSPVEFHANMHETEVGPDLSCPDLSCSDSENSAECSTEQEVQFGDWSGYNPTQSSTTWLAGDDFGMFSLESFPALKLGKSSALLFGTGFHFLNGPIAPEMPPRLFDFQLAYQARMGLDSNAMIDAKVGVGVFSDFEGSARDGVRFPGHVVWYHEWFPRLVTVLGAESYDRDDISVLPVGGIVWRPYDALILECVFPRPKVHLKLDSGKVMYLGGELGGGTWAIERLESINDNATYKDLRVTWGIMDLNKKSESVLEIGWAFNRSMEYRSGVGNTDFDGAFILRWQTHF